MDTANDDHRIRRTRFDVRLTSNRDAIRMPTRLEQYFVRYIEPGLRRSLDKHTSAGVVSIDRLEIDLGTIDPERFDSDALARIDDAIRRALADSPATVGISSQPAQRPPNWRATGGASIRLSVEQRYLYFLDTGLLPWHEAESVASLESRLMDLPEERRHAFMEAVRESAKEARVRSRIELQATAGFITWLIAFAERSKVRFPEKFVRQLVRRLGAERVDSVLESRASVPSDSETSQANDEGLSPGSFVHDTDDEGARRGVALVSTERSVGSTQDAGSETAESTTTDVYFVQGAGICLLHPFLPELFEKTGLTGSDAMFCDESARERAIHLLSFLVDGSEHGEEPGMALYKVLCEWPLSRPLRRRLPLRRVEKAECGKVLESCIAHWTRLRNTSTTALRAEFLQREGRLHRENENWRLIVEQKTIDILLDGMPWSVAQIRLPWCTSLLLVDWR